jgi:4-hydroxy-tetrahydrodipicolinate synthase
MRQTEIAMKPGRFGSIVTAMITPMHPDGSVNLNEAKRLAEWLCDHGSTGLVVCGTTGEGPTLTDEEKIALFRAVSDAVADRAAVIANTGGNDTRKSVELTRKAAQSGVDAILAVGPYYNKPPQAGMIEHFCAIADAARLPVMIYNIPSRTAVNVLPATLAELSDHSHIVAVKESSGDLNQISDVIAAVPSSFDVYAGDDPLALPTASIGGRGVVSVAAHVAGDDLRAMFDAFYAGRIDSAAEIHIRLLPMIRALFATTSPIPVKAAMARLGFAVGRCRLPLCELTNEQQRALDAAIAPWLKAPVAAPAR